MCWLSAEVQVFDFHLLDKQLGEGEWESLLVVSASPLSIVYCHSIGDEF